MIAPRAAVAAIAACLLLGCGGQLTSTPGDPPPLYVAPVGSGTPVDAGGGADSSGGGGAGGGGSGGSSLDAGSDPGGPCTVATDCYGHVPGTCQHDVCVIPDAGGVNYPCTGNTDCLAPLTCDFGQCEP